MRFLPKKDEVAVVTAILASDEYESAEEMGRAIVKAVALELAKRETFAVAHHDKPVHFFWPFFYEADARRFHEQLGALPGTTGYLLPMRSPLGDLEAKERSNT